MGRTTSPELQAILARSIRRIPAKHYKVEIVGSRLVPFAVEMDESQTWSTGRSPDDESIVTEAAFLRGRPLCLRVNLQHWTRSE